jgi:hypothetical protein
MRVLRHLLSRDALMRLDLYVLLGVAALLAAAYVVQAIVG